jgi:hypothetical protein
MSLAAEAWTRIEELDEALELTARHVASRTGGDADELSSVGRMAVIEKALTSPDFLDQTRSYITTHASWRMRDHVNRPRWAEANSVPLTNEHHRDISTPSFESRSLLRRTIADGLEGEDLTIVQAIMEHGVDVLHRDGKLNINALARALDVPKSTMYRRIHDLRETLATMLVA